MKRNLLVLIAFLSTANIFGQVEEATLKATWSDPSLLGSTAHDNTYNEVWGLYVNDHEIAVIGSTAGTHFIDVTDPDNISEIHFVKGKVSGPQIIHRDYHDHKGYLYCVADEGPSTLQIIDIRDLPNSIEVVYDSRDYFQRSHNIFIDAATDRLYACISNGDSIPFAPMRIFDISDPVDPKPIKAYNILGGYSFSQVHDAFVRNDTAYLNFGPDGFGIVNFADVENPEVLTVLEPEDYPQAGYNHSGWLTPDGAYYYMADETFQRDIKVLDLRNLPEIAIPTTINAGSESEWTIPHNQIVHNGYMYSSYYFDGLQIYDISDPANPIRKYHYPTSSRPHSPAYQGAWGVYPFLPSGNILVSDMQEGLFVLSFPVTTDVKEEWVENDLHLYPNPNQGSFEIQLPDAIKISEVQVEILDLMGRTLFLQNKISEGILKLDLEGKLTKGSYLVKVKSGDRIFVNELIIVK